MTALDYVVIALYALGMVGIGVYYARRVRTADDYLLGGRAMSPLLIGLSLFATLTSTITYLALPGEMVKNGPVIFAEFLSFPVAFLVVGWVLIPRIVGRPGITSGYELLEARLGLTGRLLGAAMFVALRVCWMATILYATANVVLLPLLDLGRDWLPWLCLIMGAVTLAYTVVGGLRAVVVTDAVQATLMVLGAGTAIAVISVRLGGVGGWWPVAWPGHWAEPVVFPTAGASRTLVGAFLNMLVWMTCNAGSDQMSIQRYLATRDAVAARRSFGVQLATNVCVGLLLGLAGLAVLGYFQARPHELQAGWSVAENADKLFPHFIVVGLPPGVTGLVIAAILAAAMSSLSSGMNSSSAVIVTDFVGRAASRAMTPTREVRFARLAAVGIGAVAVGLSLLVGQLASNLLELSFKVVNLLTVPIFVLFFLALFVRQATATTAVIAVGAALGVAVAVTFGFGGQWFLLSAPAALATGVVVGVTCSAARTPGVDTPGY